MNYAFLDEDAKKEIRRAILKAVAIPGYLVSFASREMPVAKGWGTGGMQVTLCVIKEDDVLKVIDQGCDGSVNAVNLRNFIASVTKNETTIDTKKASIIQTRHRIPQEELKDGQILVFQVPMPDALEIVEPNMAKAKQMHANADYSKIWVLLYEDTSMFGDSRISRRYPVFVNDRYIMDPSPIPKYDLEKLNNSKALQIFGAGREKKIYAIPPYTKVCPLKFDDMEFKIEKFENKICERCGASGSYMDLVYDDMQNAHYYCNDTAFCDKNLKRGQNGSKNK
ncbi:alpha-D-ribose 1-methylphosphonate 5-phosphate C-P-lyase PhnJ [Campylobacter suis]|uniref:Alpha-D-ribose 1-methylphosphonate 5-phosphate C-P lyase n=1 Tax=Campylobacter suis TaxID=2790657 RepID=A0ABM8Q907_9BACT|nr:alpha-D-ribose 1-methylphosphonate 5-phosphate C-P-lyase PhnJ [Campylobacter suis]CAD7289334.1 Alpha-D-ribose 1-methylphosphonate 5-phosphate C-P lyase [Campylobacter suis]